MGPDERPGSGVTSEKPKPERPATVDEMAALRTELLEKYAIIEGLLKSQTKQLTDCDKTLRKCLVAFSALQAHTHTADGKPVLSVGILNEAVFNS